jgi:polyhydroxyalkanoate synthesis regulator phasin
VIPTPTRPQPAARQPIGDLLDRGDLSHVQRTKTLTARIRMYVDELAKALAQEAAMDRAAAEVAALRSQLAAAEKRLRAARSGGKSAA